MTRFLWTRASIDILLEGRSGAARIPYGSIARRLGTTVHSCIGKYNRLMVDGSDAMPPAPVEVVDRECLNCSRKFAADGRFIRICSPCKNTVAFTEGGDYILDGGLGL